MPKNGPNKGQNQALTVVWIHNFLDSDGGVSEGDVVSGRWVEPDEPHKVVKREHLKRF